MHMLSSCRVHMFSSRLILSHVLSRSFFFQRCAETLTRWATMEMFNTYNTHYNNYHWFDDEDNKTTTVINKFHKDEYLVDSAFRCTNVSTTNISRRCWQQSYTGVLCIHSLLAVISRITTIPKTESKESVCRLALGACHSNWHRSTYSAFQDPTPLAKVPSVKSVVPSGNKHHPEIWQRFRDAAAFVPPEIIEEMILKIEVMALKPTTPRIRERSDTPGTTPGRVLNVRKSAVQRTLFPTPSTQPDRRGLPTGLFKDSYPLTQTRPTNFFGAVPSCMIIPDSTAKVSGTLSLSSDSPLPDFQNQERRQKKKNTKRRSQSNQTTINRPKKGKRQPNRGSVGLHQPFKKPVQAII